MPFPWTHPDVPQAVKTTFRGKALDMLRYDVKQRATLLRHLGFSQAQAEARCRQNLEWDFEIGTGPCPILSELPKLIEQVYKR